MRPADELCSGDQAEQKRLPTSDVYRLIRRKRCLASSHRVLVKAMGDARWVVVNACDVFNNYREVACFYSADDAFDYIDQHCDEDSHVEERFLPVRRVFVDG